MPELDTRVGVLLPIFEDCGFVTTSRGAGRAADISSSLSLDQKTTLEILAQMPSPARRGSYADCAHLLNMWLRHQRHGESYS
jgi:hypothetical protein